MNRALKSENAIYEIRSFSIFSYLQTFVTVWYNKFSRNIVRISLFNLRSSKEELRKGLKAEGDVYTFTTKAKDGAQ